MQSMARMMDRRTPCLSRVRAAGKFLFIGSASLLLPFILSTTMCCATPLQAAPPAANAAPLVPALNDSLRPALEQVGSALNQIQIDHWKLSREWKEQFSSDASSIQQDMSSQLPGLFQAAQQSPTELGPQLGVIHNVDALYDVLVRISTAANIASGKNDAAILDSAVQRLESARKAAASQLLQAASTRDGQIAQFRAAMAQAAESPAKIQAKTIVVDNRVHSRTKHHKTVTHRKTPVAPSSGTGATTSSFHPSGP